MNEELKAEITIPFTNSEHAKIAFNTLNVDKEPRKELISRRLSLSENDTVLRVNWLAKEARILRVSINSFFDHLHLVLNTIEQFEVTSQTSVLNKFPDNIGRPIVQSCAKHLGQYTSSQLPFSQPSFKHSSVSGSDAPANTNILLKDLTTTNTGNNVVSNTPSTNINSGVTTAQSASQANASAIAELAHEKNIIDLETVEQVNWTLENIMYGLTLSHEHQDIIKDCWNIYHDWLTVLLDEPKPFVPKPIKADPIFYSKKMLWHLYNLFVPRKEPHVPTKHIMMCHGVLVLLEEIAKDSRLLNRDLWEEFLKFNLAINNAVLSPPYNKEDFSDNMSSRLVATLFEIWLIACNKCFPSPCLWKTFQEMCSNWRHHLALVTEWNRVVFALTNRVLEVLWWPDLSDWQKVASSGDTNVAYDIQKIINSFDPETLLQAWFRFFHIIGNPIDFSNPYLLSRSNDFQRGSSDSKDLDDSTLQQTHLCLKKLPQIFLEVMKGLSQVVDTFLGIEITATQTTPPTTGPALSTTSTSTSSSSTSTTQSQAFTTGTNVRASFYSSTSPLQQSLAQQMSATADLQRTKSKAQSNQQQFDAQASIRKSVHLTNLTIPVSTTTTTDAKNLFTKCNTLKRNRPSVNSVLHLVGNWLFEASVTGYVDKLSPNTSEQLRKDDLSSPNSKSSDVPALIYKDYVLGQAEAYGILCKIFSSCKTGENILPEYLSRFYAVLYYGLRIPLNFPEMTTSFDSENCEILASILVNGSSLFKLNLTGMDILLPSFLNAIEAVFKIQTLKKDENKERFFRIGAKTISLIELKRNCINIFASIISLPNNYGNLTIENIHGDESKSKTSYSVLRHKILDIFLSAIPNEQDLINLQILFGCGRLIVGEWSSDEMQRLARDPTNDANSQLDRKQRASYCYKQIVSSVCIPLKLNSTLSNHPFALSIFDALSSMTVDSIVNEDADSVDIGQLAISWISHYVQMQIKRPSREHTREMHSVIVAAYHCLIVLIVQKPRLLRDKSCLQIISNCIEIGISGCSSYPEPIKNSTGSDEKKTNNEAKENPTILMKSEKELKPASLRVKEAAECLLCVLMEHTGNYKMNEEANTQLDEQSLAEICGHTNVKKFRYFAINGSLILAILEKSYGNNSKIPHEERTPTLTAIIRGPFGRHAWTVQLRQTGLNTKKEQNASSRESSADLKGMQSPSSSTSLTDAKSTSSVARVSTSSESNSKDKIPKCELSIPTLNDVTGRYVKNLERFRALKENQVRHESRAFERAAKLNSDEKTNAANRCVPPKLHKEFESARIFLSNLGFGSIESTSKTRSDLTEIFALDTSDTSFYETLKSLDAMPTRTFCSCYIYYAKAGQCDLKSMKSNFQNETALNTDFYLFLHSLGSIVDLKKHHGWTGNFETSWKNVQSNDSSPNEKNKKPISKQINEVNGVDYILYWSDITSEIAFILPNNTKPLVNTISQVSTPEYGLLDPPPASQQNEDTQKKVQFYASEVKLIVVWLEQMQDLDIISTNDLIEEVTSFDQNQCLSPRSTYSVIIYVHPLKNGLYRIIIWNNKNKKYFYSMPLIDGMILSTNMLGCMVRQTLLNVYRRRFESENYQPPHVRRKAKISDIIKRYHSKKNEADFYTSLNTKINT